MSDKEFGGEFFFLQTFFRVVVSVRCGSYVAWWDAVAFLDFKPLPKGEPSFRQLQLENGFW